LLIPSGDLSNQAGASRVPPVQTLAREDADFDLSWRVVKVQAAQDASSLRRVESFVQSAWVVSAQVVEHDANDRFFGVMVVDKVSHACGEVSMGLPVCDLHMAPRVAPSGGSEQAVATRRATSLAQSFRRPPGWDRLA
jgi:hypothetical protein